MVQNKPSTADYRILLTGGSGFLGKFILKEALDGSVPFPVKQLVVLDRSPLAGFSDPRISFVRGDVRDRELLMKCCEGIDLVIHSAAIVDWGTLSEQEVLSVNAEGTRRVVEACMSKGVKGMVFTSSLDVLHDGNPLLDVDEAHPYPQKHSTSYCSDPLLVGEFLKNS